MNKIVAGILSALITTYIIWLSYTVYEMSKSMAVVEFQLQTVYPVLQDLSEK